MTAPTLDIATCRGCGRPTLRRSHGRPFCSTRCRDLTDNPAPGRRTLIIPATTLWERIPSGLRDRDAFDSKPRKSPANHGRFGGRHGAARIDAVVEGLRRRPGVWMVVLPSTTSKSARNPWAARGCEVKTRALPNSMIELSARWPVAS